MGAKINLNLDKPNSLKDTQIFISVTYKGTRFRIATGELLHPKFWDKKKQCAKNSFKNAISFNAILSKYQSEVLTTCSNMQLRGISITKEIVVQNCSFKTKTLVKLKTVNDYFLEFIEVRKNFKTRSIQGYKTTLLYLKKFEKEKNYNISFEAFKQGFYDAFTNYYLNDCGHFNGGLSKQIKTLKTFLKWCTDMGYNTNQHYTKWCTQEEKSKEMLILTIDEIKSIEAIESLPEHLNSARDLFLIECFTGLRYGDIQALKKENLVDNILTITMLKTNSKLQIPLQNKALSIIKKYFDNKQSLPQISNQNLNPHLKYIAKLAGLNKPFVYTKMKGKQVITTTYKKWEKVSSHTGRHTFATIGLELGVAPTIMQKLLGHTKFTTTQRYISHNKEAVKKEIEKLN